MTMTLFCATVQGQASNSHYPNSRVITSAADLEAAVVWDHVAAGYAGGHRANKNFLTSDTLVMDLDNDHTDNEGEWVTPDDLPGLLPGVTVATATSRNHMVPKGVLSARPRFHVYLPITPCTDAGQYAGLKRALASRFEFFDRQALDAGRFIFAAPSPEVTFVDGGHTIDEWLTAQADADLFAEFDQATQSIGDGSRNSTMSRFAARVLIRYGDTAQARELFDRKADLCDPPLPGFELEQILGLSDPVCAQGRCRPRICGTGGVCAADQFASG